VFQTCSAIGSGEFELVEPRRGLVLRSKTSINSNSERC